jgi:hypothetical protein
MPVEFGIVVKDASGKPYDVLSSAAPYRVSEDRIYVPGYALPPGGSFEFVGAAKWQEALKTIAYAESPPVDPSVQRAIGAIGSATDYVADNLCPYKSRPTKVVHNLTAGFQLVFNAQTGSQVEWDLEVVCSRYQ